MLIAYWIAAGVLAAAMLVAGIRKLVLDKQALYDAGLTFTEDFTGTQVKLIALAEVLGALGLVLPMATGIVPILSPTAAACLLALLAGATATNLRRSESPMLAIAFSGFAAAATVLGVLVVLG